MSPPIEGPWDVQSAWGRGRGVGRAGKPREGGARKREKTLAERSRGGAAPTRVFPCPTLDARQAALPSAAETEEWDAGQGSARPLPPLPSSSATRLAHRGIRLGGRVRGRVRGGGLHLGARPRHLGGGRPTRCAHALPPSATTIPHSQPARAGGGSEFSAARGPSPAPRWPGQAAPRRRPPPPAPRSSSSAWAAQEEIVRCDVPG